MDLIILIGDNQQNSRPVTQCIYCSRPYSRIMFKMSVLRANIPTEEADRKDLKYIKGQIIGEKHPRFGYAMLQLECFIDSEKLTLERLCGFGLKTASQGPQKTNDQLNKYLNTVFRRENDER